MGIDINLLLSLQSLGDWPTVSMGLFTILGTSESYLLIAAALYWCRDTRLGLRMAIILFLSNGINHLLKLTFHAPRPYWVDRRVLLRIPTSGFGMPSGHAQNAVTIWGMLAFSTRKKRIWAIVISLMFVIGLSRVYLGVHFPSQVMVGWLVGAFILWVFLRLEAPLTTWLSKKTLFQQVGIVLATSLILLLLGTFMMARLKNWPLPAEWEENTATAHQGLSLNIFGLNSAFVQNFVTLRLGTEPINPLEPEKLLKSFGTLLGLAVGAILLLHVGGFDARGHGWKRLLRYVIGLVGLALIRFGPDMVFPQNDDNTLLAYSLQYLQYTLIGAWITGLGPLLFIRLRLGFKPSAS